MSADIYNEETRDDANGNERLYSIIGTIMVQYEVETPEGERFVIGLSQDDCDAQKWIDEHNREYVAQQEREQREREEAEEDEDDDEAAD